FSAFAMKIKKACTSPLACFLLLFTLNFSVGALVVSQEQQRERRVGAPVVPSAPVAAPVPVMTPGASASAAVASAPKSVAALQARIAGLMQQPQLAPAMLAVKVVSLDTGRTLYEENANKLLRPASNMKIYTVAAALDRLSPDYRFKTSAYASAPPDAAGTLRGDLIIYGRGDPSIAARFNNGDYYKGIDDFAARIAASGIKRVEGDLIGDETYFNGPALGSGWEWDDLQWWYGAEVSALSVNDNSVDLFVKPGAAVGTPCTVTTGPITPLVSITNRTTTAPRGTKRELAVYRGLGENLIEVSGSLPLDDAGYTGSVAVSRPALLFIYMLRSSLAQRGVTITGRSRTLDVRARAGIPLETSTLLELASLQSPPLSIIAAQTMKPSQNLYTELLLRTLGKVAGNSGAHRTSEEAGIEVVKTFLREAGVDPSGIIITDGSGLSRNDMVTAGATLQLLTYMSRHRYAKAFLETMPIAGVDGTLKNRLKGTAAENNVRAKTGTLSSAASLSGYVTSAAGERLVFSIMANNYPESADARKSFIDEIVILLASLDTKS
ncbi:MAG TPA: D-alanyl-D-alanine carboxypeptidase/D-alanyl-D-alanine-endopeptidase, partial [Pyrinomonadaceae bacterium]|nr:D-alanyl-D-alanine carboxypeptidase/D-alanyl-D-alanine-endopeptidase [Pyrinomonadaceae bacterium]